MRVIGVIGIIGIIRLMRVIRIIKVIRIMRVIGSRVMDVIANNGYSGIIGQIKGICL